MSSQKNLFVLNETLFRARNVSGLKLFGLTKSLNVVLDKSKNTIPVVLTNMVDLNEDINQVLLKGDKGAHFKRDIGCEQFLVKQEKKSEQTSVNFKNLNIRRGPSYLSSTLVI